MDELRTPGLRLVAVLAAASGLGCLCGDPTELLSSCADACGRDGRCGRRTWAAGDGFARCFPRGDEDCEQSRACREDGRCDYRPERALEACVAAEEASCAASTGCRDEGRCRPDYSGSCRASEAGCVASRACAEEDRCAAYDDRCVVPSDDGPRCAAACRVEGACTERDGRCLATSDEDCAGAHLCGHQGACRVGPAATCRAATDEDCAPSMMCEWNGLCTAREGACLDGLAVCEDACREQGWCGVRDAVCVPRDDADCVASLSCLVTGECARVGAWREVCRPVTDADCAGSLEGRAYGRTELRSGSCASPGARRLRDARCLRDPGCAEAGRCLTAEDGTCHAPEEYGLPPIPPERRPRRRGPRR